MYVSAFMLISLFAKLPKLSHQNISRKMRAGHALQSDWISASINPVDISNISCEGCLSGVQTYGNLLEEMYFFIILELGGPR